MAMPDVRVTSRFCLTWEKVLIPLLKAMTVEQAARRRFAHDSVGPPSGKPLSRWSCQEAEASCGPLILGGGPQAIAVDLPEVVQGK
jgi:hypothetical protein